MPSTHPALNPQARKLLEEFGFALRDLRRTARISAAAAAEAAGMSRVTLHRIEKGEPSVTAGAYAAAAVALGARWQLTDVRDARPAHDPKRWMPTRIRMGDYPKLKELAWQVQGSDELTPREALDIYERNWRYVDPGSLAETERDLVDALRAVFRA